MPDWALQEAAQWTDQVGIASGAIGGVVVTAGAVNTKGSYTAGAISASTPRKADMLLLTMTTKGSPDYLVDLAIGAAGSESIVVPNLASTGPTYGSSVYLLPIGVPAGSRLNVRSQATTSSAALSVSASLISGGMLGMPAFNRCETLGATTADSGGTGLGNPASPATMGAWTQIGTTTFPWKWVITAMGDQAITTRTSGQRFMWEIGVGAAAAQWLLIGGQSAGTSSTSFAHSHHLGFPCNIPDGSALWGRYASSAITTLGMDMILYGFG